MKHFIQKFAFPLFFLLATFSLFCQSNKPYAKNINITLENQELILTWKNPEQDSNIKNILIYNDKNPILSTNQLSQKNLVKILDKNQISYTISDINHFSPYFAVIYQLKDDSVFDILIITENTTIYNETLANKINSLFAVEIVKKPEEVETVTFEEGKIRKTPLPTVDLIQSSSDKSKTNNTFDMEIVPYIFQEDKSSTAMGIAYELNLIVSKYFPTEDFGSAATELKALLENKHEQEETSRIYFYLGECYFFTENYVEALSCFFQSEKAYPAISKKWQQYVINSFNY